MDVVYAKATVRLPTDEEHGGGVVAGGSHWPADDPVVRAHSDLFSPDPRYGLAFSVPPAGWDDPPVEQATAGPGERRQTRRAESRG